MKRKHWRVHTEHPSRIGGSNVLNDTETLENHVSSCNKRVRLRNLDSSKLQESASVPAKRLQDPRSDEPKTSEYAFFKKLREDAHSSHAHSRHQNKSQSINLKASQCSRERSISRKNLKSLLTKNATPDNMFPSISTPDYAAVVDKKTAPTSTTSSDILNTQENVEQYGNTCQSASIFSVKRLKLHQLVAKTLSVEVDELFSNGHDIVTVLLSKLFPEDSKNQSFAGLKTATSEMDTPSESFTSPKFGIRINESRWTPARNFMELECGPSLDVVFSSFLPEFQRTKELPSPNFPNSYTHVNFVDRIMELDSEGAPPNLFTEDDMDLDITKHQYLTSRHLKELDECDYSFKHLHGREPQTLLLGWDVDNMVDESILPIVSKNTELILHPSLSSLHDDDQRKNLDNSFTADELLYPIKSFHGQDTQNLLLGWDVSMLDKSNLPTVSQNTELSLNCFLPSSRCDDQRKNLDDSFGESTLCTESLVSYCPPTFEDTELSLNCFLPRLGNDDQKGNFFDSSTETRSSRKSLISYYPQNQLSLRFTSSISDKSHEKDNIFADNHISSYLPEMINQRNMSMSAYYGIACNGSNISLSPLNQLWSTRKILNERNHYLDTEAFSSAGFDFYIEPECKPVSGSSSDHYFRAFHSLECPQNEHLSSYLNGDVNENCHLSHAVTNKHLCDDMIDIHNWSSNYFHKAFGKDKPYPLLLDKSHWDESNGEKNILMKMK